MNSSPFKQSSALVAQAALGEFLRSPCRMRLGGLDRPVVSIVVLVCNRAEVTFRCFQSLASGFNETPFELIVVDNGSTDRTRELLDRIDGIRVIRNSTNVGYPCGVNQGTKPATGEYLLLLNNDTEVFGRSIDNAVDHLRRNPDVGTVGGKVILLDGTLQEAGVIIWSNGWADQYARGFKPDDPAVQFERDVDCCAGAFLMIRRALFEACGGLNEIYNPGYFEEPDFAVRIKQRGWRTRYLPSVVTLHYENATSEKLIDVQAISQRNHGFFYERHRDWLADQPKYDAEEFCRFRWADDTKFKMLFSANALDSSVVEFVKRIQKCDAFVTVASPSRESRSNLPSTVEVVEVAPSELASFCKSRPNYYDIVAFDKKPNSSIVDPLQLLMLTCCYYDGRRLIPI